MATNNTDAAKEEKKAGGLGISLDAWAVALGLALALLVRLGWIQRVPW